MTTRKKTGGRSKGTPNRTTAETKELLQKIVNKEIDSLGLLLEQLEPNERVNALSKLLPYIVPKQSEVKNELITIETKEQKIDVSKISTEVLIELEQAYLTHGS